MDSPSPASYRPRPARRIGPQLGVPGRRVPGRVDVRPGQRRSRGGQQDRRAAGLRMEESAKRRLQPRRPQRTQEEPRGGGADLGHSRILSRAAQPGHRPAAPVNRKPAGCPIRAWGPCGAHSSSSSLTARWIPRPARWRGWQAPLTGPISIMGQPITDVPGGSPAGLATYCAIC